LLKVYSRAQGEAGTGTAARTLTYEDDSGRRRYPSLLRAIAANPTIRDQKKGVTAYPTSQELQSGEDEVTYLLITISDESSIVRSSGQQRAS
jgi:hypothetical protein